MNLPEPLDAGKLMVIMAIIVITQTVTQGLEDLRLEMVQDWVLVC